MNPKEYSIKIYHLKNEHLGKGLVTIELNKMAKDGWCPILQSIVKDKDNQEHWYFTFERDRRDPHLIAISPEELI